MTQVFNTDKLITQLSTGAESLGICLTETQLSGLLQYMSLMLKWNKTYNLTSITEPEQMITHHLLDSLAIMPKLIASLEHVSHPTIMDVGSGGGLPSAVIAIMRSDWIVMSVDAVEKKTSFVRQVASVLNLKNLQAIHARIEQLSPKNADVIISRAFASLYDFVTLSEKHLNPSGKFIAMKGIMPIDEIDELTRLTNYAVVDSTVLDVPNLNAQRCLLFLKTT